MKNSTMSGDRTGRCSLTPSAEAAAVSTIVVELVDGDDSRRERINESIWSRDNGPRKYDSDQRV